MRVIKELDVQFSKIDGVKRFNQAAFEAACDIEICAGRYNVDAKSLVGIFSLDLSKPVVVKCRPLENREDEFEDAFETFKEKIKDLLK